MPKLKRGALFVLLSVPIVVAGLAPAADNPTPDTNFPRLNDPTQP